MQPEILTVIERIRLLNLRPPVPGYYEFICPYLLTGEINAVIDIGPASAMPSFLQLLKKAYVAPSDIAYIIFTHIHIDHAGCAGTAIKKLPNAKVIAHGRAHEHLTNPKALWEASLKVLGDYAVKSGAIEPVPDDRIIDVVDGMKLDLGYGMVLQFYLTPGHAVHHLCVWYPAQRLLFAGEAAGVCINGAVRLATPPPFKLDVMLSSIDRLIEFEPRLICYSHFGCYDNAVNRLKLYRKKVVQWYELVNSEAVAGKNLSQIVGVLRGEDKDLDYLDSLSADIYAREISLINNSIRGLAGMNLK